LDAPTIRQSGPVVPLAARKRDPGRRQERDRAERVIPEAVARPEVGGRLPRSRQAAGRAGQAGRPAKGTHGGLVTQKAVGERDGEADQDGGGTTPVDHVRRSG
jgi:hypothetical protein